MPVGPRRDKSPNGCKVRVKKWFIPAGGILHPAESPIPLPGQRRETLKVLAALDQSAYAEFVLNKAIKTARQMNAKLEIMVVAEKVGDGWESFDLSAVNAQMEESAEAAAVAYRKLAKAKEMPSKIRVASGASAADEIIRYQKAENLDLIVLGRRSHKDRDIFPMGHVAQRVAAHATCTVMIVR